MKGFMNDSQKTKTWYRFVPYFIRMNHFIAAYNRTLRRRQRGMKGFNVIPQYSWKTKHIKIDTEAMFSLNNSVSPRGHKGDLNNKRGVWDDIVPHMPKRSKYSFDGSITTNCVSTTVTIRHRSAAKNNKYMTQEEKEQIDQENKAAKAAYDRQPRRPSRFFVGKTTNEVPQEIKDRFTHNYYDVLAGIDPGYRNPAAGVRLHVNEDLEHNFKFTIGQCRSFQQQWERDNRRKKITKRFDQREKATRKQFEDVHGVQPSSKDPNYLQYINHKLEFFKQGCDVYQHLEISRLALDAYIMKWKGITHLAKTIIGKHVNGSLNKALIFFGDAKVFAANSPITGHVRFSQATLRKCLERYADVVYVNEFNTTKVCNKCFKPFKNLQQNPSSEYSFCKDCVNCNGVLPPPSRIKALTHRNYRVKFEYRQKYRIFEHFQRAPGQRNGKTYNRDAIAGRSIMYKGICLTADLPIEQYFTKKEANWDFNI